MFQQTLKFKVYMVRLAISANPVIRRIKGVFRFNQSAKTFFTEMKSKYSWDLRTVIVGIFVQRNHFPFLKNNGILKMIFFEYDLARGY